MNMKRKILPAALVLISVGVLLVLKTQQSEEFANDPVSTPGKEAGPNDQIHSPVAPHTSPADPGATVAEEKLSPAIQHTPEAMEDFLDDGDNAAALKIARTLTGHTNRTVRIEALTAMQWIGGPAAFDITDFFDDPDPVIRKMAVDIFNEAIDDFETPELKLKLLTSALESPSLQTRQIALEELLFLPDHLSFKPMASALNDTNEDLRDLARNNLEFISEEAFESEQAALAWFNTYEKELMEQSSIQ